jgi:transposase InsO family protein
MAGARLSRIPKAGFARTCAHRRVIVDRAFSPERFWRGGYRTRWMPTSALQCWRRRSASLISSTRIKARKFTSFAFTNTLKDADIRISMDGRGRWMDNVFIERLWRSLNDPQGISLVRFIAGLPRNWPSQKAALRSNDHGADDHGLDGFRDLVNQIDGIHPIDVINAGIAIIDRAIDWGIEPEHRAECVAGITKAIQGNAAVPGGARLR